MSVLYVCDECKKKIDPTPSGDRVYNTTGRHTLIAKLITPPKDKPGSANTHYRAQLDVEFEDGEFCAKCLKKYFRKTLETVLREL